MLWPAGSPETLPLKRAKFPHLSEERLFFLRKLTSAVAFQLWVFVNRSARAVFPAAQ